MDSYEPIEREDCYWVYAKQKGEELHIYVGNSLTRMYNLTGLPDHIRSQLAMIHTQDWKQFMWVRVREIAFPSWYPEQYEDIGWMLSADEYVLVLPEEVLEELRGEVSRG